MALSCGPGCAPDIVSSMERRRNAPKICSDGSESAGGVQHKHHKRSGGMTKHGKLVRAPALHGESNYIRNHAYRALVGQVRG
jgi:hypothetical protein